VVELPFAAGCCPCVERLRTVLPFTVGIRDGVVHLVSTLGSAVISARAELGRIITSAHDQQPNNAICCFPRHPHRSLRLQVNSRTHAPIQYMRGFCDPMYHQTKIALSRLRGLRA
jgi:hypothetical protein